MSRCSAELCKYFTGSGCACEVFDIEPEAEETGFCLKCEDYHIDDSCFDYNCSGCGCACDPMEYDDDQEQCDGCGCRCDVFDRNDR